MSSRRRQRIGALKTMMTAHPKIDSETGEIVYFPQQLARGAASQERDTQLFRRPLHNGLT